MYVKAGVLYSVSTKDVVNGVLEIPEGVFRVNEGALNIVKDFYKVVKKLIIPGSFVEVQENLFKGGTSLEKVEFREGVQKIADGAFSGCTGLTSISFPDTLKEIGNKVFENTSISNLTLSENVEEIGNYAFADNQKLVEVDLSNNKKLEVINKETFSGCKNLKKIDFGVDSSVNTIKQNVFEDTKLQSLKLPKSLRAMYASSVSGLSKIKKLNFGDGFESLIGALEVANMKSLKEVVIPNTAKKVAIYDDYGLAHKDLKVVVKQSDGTKIVKENLSGKRLVVNSNHEGIKAIYLQKDIELVENNKVFELNNVNYLKIKNYHRLLGEYKADTVYLWMKELQKHLGENILVYPKAEEISVIPVNRMGDYVKNRKIINEILKKTEHLTYSTRRSLLSLALNLGVLEQNQGIKNEVITLFREHIFNSNYFNKIPSITLDGIKDKSSFTYNAKYNKLIKDLFLNSNSLRHDLGTMIAAATNNFEKIISFKRNPSVETIEGFLNTNKYSVKNSSDFRVAEVAAALNISTTDFDFIAKTFRKSENMKTKNFIEHMAYKAVGEQFRNDLSGVSHNLKDDNNTSNFTFEWLDRDNPYTAFLGYICDSCATIDKVGAPILTASLIQDNVQNLVVKDKFGAIVAKVSGFLDAEKGMILFNSVEANSNFLDKIDLKGREEVVSAFKRGIDKMVTAYNSVANKLVAGGIKKVNMVMLHNKFREQFENEAGNKFDMRSYFNGDFLGYPVDSLSQVTLYNADKIKKAKQIEVLNEALEKTA